MAARQARRRGRWLGLAALAIVGVVGAWLGGLAWFVSLVPRAVADPATVTDAIVVLTGGVGRLDTGLTLLARKSAKKLFVSGVYQGVDVTRILEISRRQPGEFSCCVALGYAASSTAGNAVESRSWLRKEGYRSVRLVTANYHMPRSLLEFRHALPKAAIVPHAVFPTGFKLDRWWIWPGSANLIVSEYTKFLLARLRHVVDGDRGAAP